MPEIIIAVKSEGNKLRENTGAFGTMPRAFNLKELK